MKEIKSKIEPIFAFVTAVIIEGFKYYDKSLYTVSVNYIVL